VRIENENIMNSIKQKWPYTELMLIFNQIQAIHKRLSKLKPMPHGKYLINVSRQLASTTDRPVRVQPRMHLLHAKQL
jgi:hypothetical protein